MRVLLLPIVLLVLAYLLNCLVISALLHRFCGIRRREAMLAATPAGANDMAQMCIRDRTVPVQWCPPGYR